MLRKRTRSIQKDQHQMGHPPISDSGSESYFHSDVFGNNFKTNTFYTVPGLLVGFNTTSLTDSDSVRSPTSPLDFRVLSNLGNPFRSPRSTQDGQQKSWGSNKVGLSIIDSLDDDVKLPGKVLRPSESKNIIFGPRLRIKSPPNGQAKNNSFESAKSLPKNCAVFPHSKTKSPLKKGSSDVLFEIGEAPFEPESLGKVRPCSLDSCRKFLTLPRLIDRNPNFSSGKFCVDNVTNQASSPESVGGSPNSNQFSGKKLSTIPGSIGSVNGFVGSLSASEIELSEDYTCVISHGPNPKTTHIYGDCILETLSDDLNNFGKSGDEEIGALQPFPNSEDSNLFSNDFLSFCYSCNKKLEEGKDIYIYRCTMDFPSTWFCVYVIQIFFAD